MSEQLRRTEGKSDEEGYPKYYCVLELDQESPPPESLVIGKRGTHGEVWTPDIDLPGHLGLFKSTIAKKQMDINSLNKTITLGEEAFESTYHNGRLLERGELVPLLDGDMVNIGDIQLFIHFVPSTGTGKPFYLYTICDRIPLYSKKSDMPKTPWNPEGYSPQETMVVEQLQKEVPVWLVKEAQKDARTWDLKDIELLTKYLEAERLERETESKRNPSDLPTGGLERHRQLMAKIDEQHQEQKKAWLTHQMERKPVYSPTKEEGIFAGIFGFLVSAWSAREFPYYQTPSGVYFFEWTDDEGKNKKVIQLDLDDMIEADSVLFFSAESWLEHEPIALRKR